MSEDKTLWNGPKQAASFFSLIDEIARIRRRQWVEIVLLVWVLVMLFLLAACAQSSRQWEGRAPEEFPHDREYCWHQTDFDECMKARHWKVYTP